MTIRLQRFDLDDQYDTYLVDMWGTVYDRDAGLYSDAHTLLKRLKAHGKTVILTSNASRPAAPEIELRLGDSLDRRAYDMMMTAGEVLRLAAADRALPFSGRRYLTLGGTLNSGLLDDLGFVEVVDVGDADFVVFAGLAGGDTATEPDDPAIQLTQDILSRALARRLDLFVNKTDWVTWLADGKGWIGTGAFAQWYLDEGGPVHYMGKPYPAYYDAIRRFVDLDKSRVLIIGDHLLTDIAGGLNQGFDTLFVDTLPEGEMAAVRRLIKALDLSYVLPQISPNYVIDALR